MKTLRSLWLFTCTLGLLVATVATYAQSAGPEETPAASLGGDADLAQELTNPVADLITIPIQMTFDNDIGIADDGMKVTTNVQPVIPFEISDDWNLISRTIIPVIYQDDIFPGAGSQFGLGDINQSLFFSPKNPTSGGVIWGVGPILLLPTATDSKLGAKKWGAGPTALALTMRGPWTMGALGNHIWSFAGDKDRIDISNTNNLLKSGENRIICGRTGPCVFR